MGTTYPLLDGPGLRDGGEVAGSHQHRPVWEERGPTAPLLWREYHPQEMVTRGKAEFKPSNPMFPVSDPNTCHFTLSVRGKERQEGPRCAAGTLGGRTAPPVPWGSPAESPAP